MRKELVVFGAGGHAKVVIATARACGWDVVAAYDDDEQRHGSEILAVPIQATPNVISRPAVIAIGDNRVRQRLAAQQTITWASLVHPTAVVAPSVRIEVGAVVFAGCVLQPDIAIEAHAIVNTAAHIDHDCRIGAFAHVAPGASLCGNVHLGEGSLVGVGAALIPGVQIGAWARVGAGAAVIRNVPANATAVGVPATYDLS